MGIFDNIGILKKDKVNIQIVITAECYFLFFVFLYYAVVYDSGLCTIQNDKWTRNSSIFYCMPFNCKQYTTLSKIRWSYMYFPLVCSLIMFILSGISAGDLKEILADEEYAVLKNVPSNAAISAGGFLMAFLLIIYRVIRENKKGYWGDDATFDIFFIYFLISICLAILALVNIFLPVKNSEEIVTE